MNVNFNNLRKKTCKTVDLLTRKLNACITADGIVEVPAEDIQDVMNELQELVGSIAMCYNPNDDDVINVFSELYPGENDGMVDFNPDKE
jgi:hypothetical protein